MRRVGVALIMVVILLGAASVGLAQKPPKPPGQADVTLKASANAITFSQAVTLTGSVKGARAGVTVALQRRATTAAAFDAVATTTTDRRGDFTFTDRPGVNSVYRAVAATTPPVQSADVVVGVRPRVGFLVSDSTPTAGQRVRFRGTVWPPHDGRRVSIQRKRADGSFVTIARPILRDAGDLFSRYRRRVTVRRTATYRVRIAAHADHLAGISRERTLTVG